MAECGVVAETYVTYTTVRTRLSPLGLGGRYNQTMQMRRIIQDSGNVETGRRLLGNIRALLYIGVAVSLAIVYVLNHYR
jgi:hypothetical protein